MEVVVVGAGIGGLTLALCLQQRGQQCRVYESVPRFHPLGAGISLLPHGVSELDRLGLLPRIREVAVEFKESRLFNSFGQLIYVEPAHPDRPQFLIHRANLHEVLLDAFNERVGPDRIALGHRCVGVEQDADGATALFDHDGTRTSSQRADVVVGCDGIHSGVRAHLYPDEGPPVFSGINIWRGLTRHPPFLSGGTHVRAGALDTGKMVIYPVVNDVDGRGNQLVNWAAEIRTKERISVDWSRPGDLRGFYPAFADWRFDWLDAAKLLRDAEAIFEWPMCDRNPLDRWSFGRVTLLGDAAHAMLPRGSNGGMQAMIDARVLADHLARGDGAISALTAYERERRDVVNRIVLTNRTMPPDHLIETVDRLSGHKPFRNLEDVISQEQLRSMFEDYKALTGYGRTKA